MWIPKQAEFLLLKMLVGSRPRNVRERSRTPVEEALAEGQRKAIACLGGEIDLSAKRVCDFGCGEGWAAVWIKKQWPSADVWACDLQEHLFADARAYARRNEIDVTFCGRLPADSDTLFDVLLSHDAFEHFENPAGVLSLWAAVLTTHGRVHVKFGPLWASPGGIHMSGSIRRRGIPWLQLLFREETVMRLWSEMAAITPPLRWYSQKPGGLNKMTLRKYRRTIANSQFRIESETLLPVRKIWRVRLLGVGRVLAKIPVVQELFVGGVQCVLVCGPSRRAMLERENVLRSNQDQDRSECVKWDQ